MIYDTVTQCRAPPPFSSLEFSYILLQNLHEGLCAELYGNDDGHTFPHTEYGTPICLALLFTRPHIILKETLTRYLRVARCFLS
jgi:hypothetical protein